MSWLSKKQIVSTNRKRKNDEELELTMSGMDFDPFGFDCETGNVGEANNGANDANDIGDEEDNDSDDELFSERRANKIKADKCSSWGVAKLRFPQQPKKIKHIGTRCIRPLNVRFFEGCVPVHRDELESEQYILKTLFGDKLSIREVVLGANHPHSIGCTESFAGGTISTLVAAKIVDKSKGGCGKYGKYQPDVVRMYFIQTSGPDFDTLDIGHELELLGNLKALPPYKAAARLELLLSPAEWRRVSDAYPLIFDMKPKEFEEIHENCNDGCGFAPEEFFLRWYGPQKGREVWAVQVRIIIPSKGWYKGVLMRKYGIDRIQLPLSMKKVEASTFKSLRPKWAKLKIIQSFPTRSSTLMGNFLDPTKASPSTNQERDLKLLRDQAMYKALLMSNGVPQDMLEEYVFGSSKYEGRHHAGSLLGVADATESLPPNTIFVSGLGTLEGPNSRNKFKNFFVSKPPSTEKDDGLVLKGVIGKTRGMTATDWEYFQNLPFGFVVFSAQGESIPARLGTDLDGDQYTSLWDENIVGCIAKAKKKKKKGEGSCLDGNDEDPVLCCEFQYEDDQGKVQTAYVIKRLNNGLYLVSVGTETIAMSKEKIMKGKTAVDDILGHRNKGRQTEVLLRWSDGDETWEWLSIKKDEIPTKLADYAVEKNLLNTPGWEWTKKYVRVPKIVSIEDHKKDKVLVKWDHGIVNWEPMEEMKSQAREKLINYAKENKIMNTKRWMWVKRDLEEKSETWFEQTQESMANIHQKFLHKKLTKNLHSEWKKAMGKIGEDPGAEDAAKEFGRAYKKSLEIQKHGGKVDLRIEYHGHLKCKELHQFL